MLVWKDLLSHQAMQTIILEEIIQEHMIPFIEHTISAYHKPTIYEGPIHNTIHLFEQVDFFFNVIPLYFIISNIGRRKSLIVQLMM